MKKDDKDGSSDIRVDVKDSSSPGPASSTSSPPVSPSARRLSGSAIRSGISRRLSGAVKNLNVNLENIKEDILGENCEPIVLQSMALKMAYTKLFESRLELWEHVEDSLWLNHVRSPHADLITTRISPSFD